LFLYLAGLRGVMRLAPPGMRWEELPGMTLGMRYEELPGMPLDMRWEELAGMRCTNLLVPGVPRFSLGDRCTNLLVPGVPRFSLGDRCTVLLVMGAGMVMILRFLGFLVPIVV